MLIRLSLIIVIVNCYNHIISSSLLNVRRSSLSLSSSSSSTSNAITDSNRSLKVQVADTLLSTIFSIKPLFNIAKSKAREKMINQGSLIGVDWAENKKNLEKDIEILQSNYDKVANRQLQYPSYYLKPFHAYGITIHHYYPS